MIGNGDIIILPFSSPEKIKVEIHWRLNPGPGREPSFNELWERKAISSITTNQPIYILGNMDLFLFLVSHGARHGWSRLRWLEDIDMLLKKKWIGRKKKFYLEGIITRILEVRLLIYVHGYFLRKSQ